MSKANMSRTKSFSADEAIRQSPRQHKQPKPAPTLKPGEREVPDRSEIGEGRDYHGRRTRTRPACAPSSAGTRQSLGASGQSARTGWPARLLLADGCTIHRVTARSYVIDANGDDVTAAQLAIDRQIKEGKVALLALDLELRSDRPHVAGSQWRLGADKLPFVPRHANWLQG